MTASIWKKAMLCSKKPAPLSLPFETTRPSWFRAAMDFKLCVWRKRLSRMPSNDSRKILIVAAEASSCLYAQRLLQYWKKNDVQVEAFGIGNEAMAKEGFECLGRAEDLAVVGVQEVIAHWGVIKNAFYS